jgi:tRNA (guanosine-2'-O-)-methyltransferase
MASDPVVARREMDGLLRRGRLTSFDPSWFRYGEHVLEPGEIVAILRPHLSPARIARIDAVLDDRTYNLAVVVDGMVDTGNVSAVMRSADAFGVQAFHAIDRAGSYKHSKRTAQGARKWVDRWVWREPAEAIESLRRQAYRLVVADLDPAATPIGLADLSGRAALIFGNEFSGVSDELRAAADEVVAIEMSGFAQSLNISVAAAICLYEARRCRLERLGTHGDLSPGDRDRLQAVFTIKSVRHSRKIIERALDGDPPKGETPAPG